MADFDIAIIGGGINGTGIARDAAGRGLKVLLVEMNDLGSGTSSASTKLIHGGLRYLEHRAFRLVREALNEREVLLTHANWSYRGGIERNVRAIDVSPNNDWTNVRVWYGPIGDLGLRPNAAKGFIYAQKPIAAPVQIAMADRATVSVDGAQTAF